MLLGFAALTFALMPAAGAQTCGDADHPSGNDRCVEEGNSAPQGKAAADPDDNDNPPERSNGGLDQPPTGPGGENPADRDANNGCGNDQDFEDDNEGLCGGPEDEETTVVERDDDDDRKKRKNSNKNGGDVKSDVSTRKSTAVKDDTGTTAVKARGIAATNPRQDDVANRQLAATGTRTDLAVLAFASILLGTLMLRRSPRKSSETTIDLTH